MSFTAATSPQTPLRSRPDVINGNSPQAKSPLSLRTLRNVRPSHSSDALAKSFVNEHATKYAHLYQHEDEEEKRRRLEQEEAVLEEERRAGRAKRETLMKLITQSEEKENGGPRQTHPREKEVPGNQGKGKAKPERGSAWRPLSLVQKRQGVLNNLGHSTGHSRSASHQIPASVFTATPRSFSEGTPVRARSEYVSTSMDKLSGQDEQDVSQGLEVLLEDTSRPASVRLQSHTSSVNYGNMSASTEPKSTYSWATSFSGETAELRTTAAYMRNSMEEGDASSAEASGEVEELTEGEDGTPQKVRRRRRRIVALAHTVRQLEGVGSREAEDPNFYSVLVKAWNERPGFGPAADPSPVNVPSMNPYAGYNGLTDAPPPLMPPPNLYAAPPAHTYPFSLPEGASAGYGRYSDLGAPQLSPAFTRHFGSPADHHLGTPAMMGTGFDGYPEFRRQDFYEPYQYGYDQVYQPDTTMYNNQEPDHGALDRHRSRSIRYSYASTLHDLAIEAQEQGEKLMTEKAWMKPLPNGGVEQNENGSADTAGSRGGRWSGAWGGWGARPQSGLPPIIADRAEHSDLPSAEDAADRGEQRTPERGLRRIVGKQAIKPAASADTILASSGAPNFSKPSAYSLRSHYEADPNLGPPPMLPAGAGPPGQAYGLGFQASWWTEHSTSHAVNGKPEQDFQYGEDETRYGSYHPRDNNLEKTPSGGLPIQETRYVQEQAISEWKPTPNASLPQMLDNNNSATEPREATFEHSTQAQPMVDCMPIDTSHATPGKGPNNLSQGEEDYRNPDLSADFTAPPTPGTELSGGYESGLSTPSFGTRIHHSPDVLWGYQRTSDILASGFQQTPADHIETFRPDMKLSTPTFGHATGLQAGPSRSYEASSGQLQLSRPQAADQLDLAPMTASTSASTTSDLIEREFPFSNHCRPPSYSTRSSTSSPLPPIPLSSPPLAHLPPLPRLHFPPRADLKADQEARMRARSGSRSIRSITPSTPGEVVLAQTQGELGILARAVSLKDVRPRTRLIGEREDIISDQQTRVMSEGASSAGLANGLHPSHQEQSVWNLESTRRPTQTMMHDQILIQSGNTVGLLERRQIKALNLGEMLNPAETTSELSPLTSATLSPPQGSPVESTTPSSIQTQFLPPPTTPISPLYPTFSSEAVLAPLSPSQQNLELKKISHGSIGDAVNRSSPIPLLQSTFNTDHLSEETQQANSAHSFSPSESNEANGGIRQSVPGLERVDPQQDEIRDTPVIHGLPGIPFRPIERDTPIAAQQLEMGQASEVGKPVVNDLVLEGRVSSIDHTTVGVATTMTQNDRGPTGCAPTDVQVLQAPPKRRIDIKGPTLFFLGFIMPWCWIYAGWSSRTTPELHTSSQSSNDLEKAGQVESGQSTRAAEKGSQSWLYHPDPWVKRARIATVTVLPTVAVGAVAAVIVLAILRG